MNMKPRLGTALIYPVGDLIAQFTLQEFSLYRTLSLTFLALAFYQWEIPRWFKMLDNFVVLKDKKINSLVASFVLSDSGQLNWLGRTIGAIIYFNPLWIARHMFFISLGNVGYSGLVDFNELLLSSLMLGGKSFLINLPISFIGNFIVQVKLKLEHRFLGSVILTNIMAICYAIAYRFF